MVQQSAHDQARKSTFGSSSRTKKRGWETSSTRGRSAAYRMSFGIIVEGTSDEAVYSVLVSRIASPTVLPVSRVCGGNTQLMNKLSLHLRELEGRSRVYPIEKVLVIQDCDGKDRVALEDR